MKTYWNGIVANCPVVNLRSSPTKDEDNVIGYAVSGSIFPIVEKVDGFYKVQNNGETFYIHENFIEESHRKLKNIRKERNGCLNLIQNRKVFLKRKEDDYEFW